MLHILKKWVQILTLGWAFCFGMSTYSFGAEKMSFDEEQIDGDWQLNTPAWKPVLHYTNPLMLNGNLVTFNIRFFHGSVNGIELFYCG